MAGDATAARQFLHKAGFTEAVLPQLTEAPMTDISTYKLRAAFTSLGV
jgi:hypothetical protein